ncbi:MAG: hypothetical protein K2L30_09860, partial [Duncaniella sp.]|nr:hypothetical protein [Duncaniella sp.]
HMFIRDRISTSAATTAEKSLKRIPALKSSKGFYPFQFLAEDENSYSEKEFLYILGSNGNNTDLLYSIPYPDMEIKCAAFAEDRLVISGTDGSNSTTFYIYETCTYERVETFSIYGSSCSSLTFNNNDNSVYGIFTDSENHTEISRIDIEEHTVSSICTPDKEFTSLLCIDDVLTGIDNSDTLYSIDSETGETASMSISIEGQQAAYYREPFFIMYACDMRKYHGYSGTTILTVKKDASDKNVYFFSNRINGYKFRAIKSDVVTNDYYGFPKSPKDLKVSVSGLTAEVSFNLPTQIYSEGGDTDITDPISYTVTCNNNIVATGTAIPGSIVNKTLTFEKPTIATISVYAENETGKSTRLRESVFFDITIPATIESVTLDHDNLKAQISWTPVTLDNHGSPLDNDCQVTYRVTRLTDNAIIADNITETETSDPIALDEGIYPLSYSVAPVINGYVGVDTRSNTCNAGAATIPYVETFAKESRSRFSLPETTYDRFGQQLGWQFNLYRESHYFGYYCHENKPEDGIAYSGPVKLEAGKKYMFRIKLYSGYYDAVNNLDILISKFSTNDSPITIAQGIDMVYNLEMPAYSEFSVPETGFYRIGLNAKPSDYSVFVIREFSIVEKDDSKLPSKPEDISILFGDATYTPIKHACIYADWDSVDPEIEESTMLVTSRNGIPVHSTFMKSSFSYTDYAPYDTEGNRVRETGFYEYAVTAYNRYGKSEPFVKELFFQSDFTKLPAVTNLKGETTPDAVNLSWDITPNDYAFIVDIERDGTCVASLYRNTFDATEVPSAYADGEDSGYWIPDMDTSVAHEYKISTRYLVDSYTKQSTTPATFISRPYSGIDNISDSGNLVRVSTGNNCISIENADGEIVEITSLNGYRIFSGIIDNNGFSINIAPGFYLVTVSGKTVKVIVK